jgi:hypothetical protein
VTKWNVKDMNPGPAMVKVTVYVCRWPGRSRTQLQRMFHHGAIDRALAGGMIADHGTARLASFHATDLGKALLQARGQSTATYRELYGTDEATS